MAIKITSIENNSCLKCGKIQHVMTKVGAFVMSNICSVDEFGPDYSFQTDSPYYQVYIKWMEIYQSKI